MHATASRAARRAFRPRHDDPQCSLQPAHSPAVSHELWCSAAPRAEGIDWRQAPCMRSASRGAEQGWALYGLATHQSSAMRLNPLALHMQSSGGSPSQTSQTCSGQPTRSLYRSSAVSRAPHACMHGCIPAWCMCSRTAGDTPTPMTPCMPLMKARYGHGFHFLHCTRGLRLGPKRWARRAWAEAQPA